MNAVERLFEHARTAARAKMQDGTMREAELDDMSTFIIYPDVAALPLSKHSAQNDKNCILT